MDTIRGMFEHLHWANQKILETLKNSQHENEKERKLFSHILFSEHVWFARIQGTESLYIPLWPEVSIETCEELVNQNYKYFNNFLLCFTELNLEQEIVYKNTRGKEFKNTIRDILTHVALHGQYHRGQINLKLKEDGSDPVEIDFISFKREGS